MYGSISPVYLSGCLPHFSSGRVEKYLLFPAVSETFCYFPFYSQRSKIMYSELLSAAVCGLDVVPVRVEADISHGLPQFIMVGYLNSQVRESSDRVQAALQNSGITLPTAKIVINMSPGDVPKSGTRFDLPVALSILSAAHMLPPDSLNGIMAIGELRLNGELSPVTGVLPTAMEAEKCGVRTLIVPEGNKSEALAVKSVPVFGAKSLHEVIGFLRGEDSLPAPEPDSPPPALNRYSVDFRDIRGQEAVKRAAVIAVSGFHNLLLVGPPGSGKSMVAQRIPTILPGLSLEEALEISGIYSIAGLLDPKHPIVSQRPFRHPHHTVTSIALAGGGRFPVPGEVTLAHRGVLFLDELPEFSRNTLEILRQPLEDREITISRITGTYRYPANFLLLAAMNPCPCGYYPDTGRCSCTWSQIHRYQSRISRPLLDRMDLSCVCPEVPFKDLVSADSTSKSSEEMRLEVESARKIQKERFKGTSIHFNSEISSSEASRYCPLTGPAKKELEHFYTSYRLSARSYHRILRVARTIADLASSDLILPEHVLEAISYKTFRPGYWVS